MIDNATPAMPRGLIGGEAAPPGRVQTARRRRALRALKRLGGTLVALVGLGWLGLQVQPAPFPAYASAPGQARSVALPAGLPAPVDRFYRAVYGERIPVIESAVITGRARIRPFGVTLPARFRFTHVAGQGYRHYIEATWFGIPVMKVNERYLDGVAVGEMPFGIVASGPKQDQGANLGMWSETMWFPSVFLTDPRVRWEAVDDVTALLVVPYGEAEEKYVVRFDPDTGLPRLMEAMRYKGDEAEGKILWLNSFDAWEEHAGVTTLKTGSATWLEDGRPWAVFTVEEILLNADLSEYVRQKGL